MNKNAFQNIVWDFYKKHFRPMPWRYNTDPYYVMVSEIMLQQTQVSRVIPKFESFINRFPNIESLAKAELSEVLEQWIGLGYNRRARFLKQASEIIVEQYNCVYPKTLIEWSQLPGFGKNTASAVLVYSFNQPLVFIETNIRTVFIHHFFKDKDNVTDSEIETLVSDTLDFENPREWYWALMDYGTYLKKEFGNASKKAAVYAKQSKFEGSFRQKRAAILRYVVTKKMATFEELCIAFPYSDEVIQTILEKLTLEGFLCVENGCYMVK